MDSKIIVEGRVLDTLYVYQIIKKLVTPFKKTKAYSLGIIDKDGNVLKPRKDLETQEEKKAYTTFDTLIFNLKKLLAKIPGGKTRLGTFVAGLMLLKEEKNIEFHLNQELLDGFLEEQYKLLMDSVKENKEQFEEQNKQFNVLVEAVKEEMTTADVPTTQEPVVGPLARKRYKKKNLKTARGENGTGPRSVDGTCFRENEEEEEINGVEQHGDFRVFNVDSGTFNKAKYGKKRFDRYNKYVGDAELGDHIREYGRRNPKMPVILKDEKTGQLCFLRYGTVAAEQIRNYYGN